MGIRLRRMERGDWSEITDLIYVSLNYWYAGHGMGVKCEGGPGVEGGFCEVYEGMDRGCCVVVEDDGTGRLMGCCFYHPRSRHVSLGIMSVHPNYFGMGVAKRMVKYITDIADGEGKAVRLVSSAMNLDSYSVYTRAGFVPYAMYQDMTISVGSDGMGAATEGDRFVREAVLGDVERMVELEMEVSGIERGCDFELFIKNESGDWHVSIYEDDGGRVSGFLVSSGGMLGPGVMRGVGEAESLILAELNERRGGKPVFLVPVEYGELVRRMYEWGGRNCEIHVGQVRGEAKRVEGVVMPTFMPETG